MRWIQLYQAQKSFLNNYPDISLHRWNRGWIMVHIVSMELIEIKNLMRKRMSYVIKNNILLICCHLN